jgi:hypothetical protein
MIITAIDREELGRLIRLHVSYTSQDTTGGFVLITLPDNTYYAVTPLLKEELLARQVVFQEPPKKHLRSFTNELTKRHQRRALRRK